MAAGAAAARAFEGVTECAPHPAHAPSHACVRARDTGACNMPWVQQRRCLRRTLRESSSERRVGDGAGCGSSETGRVLVAASRRRSTSAAYRRTGVSGRRRLGLIDDWRRMTRAGAEPTGASERVPVSVSATTTGKGPLARAGHLGERGAAPTGLELLGRGVYVLRFSPQFPPLFLFSSISTCTRGHAG